MLERKLGSSLDFPFPVLVAAGRSRDSIKLGVYLTWWSEMEKDRSVLEAKNHQAFDIPWHFDYNYSKDFVYYKLLSEAMSEFFYEISQ